MAAVNAGPAVTEIDRVTTGPPDDFMAHAVSPRILFVSETGLTRSNLCT